MYCVRAVGVGRHAHIRPDTASADPVFLLMAKGRLPPFSPSGGIVRASDVTIEWLREYLEGWEGSDGQYYAWCPVHDDQGTSVKGLSITVKPSGKILVKCHSPHCGATLTDVIKALEGFSPDDDDIPDVKVRKTPSIKGKAGLATWVGYTQVDAHIWEQLGCLDHGDGVRFTFAESDVIKVRKFPKDIHFEPKGAEVSPLWPIPQDELPEHISITEGESDCGTTYAASLPPGFSVTKGADTPLSVATFSALASRGVREVTVYADADQSGASLRDTVTSLAIDAGLAVNICDLTRIVDPFYPHKDLNSLWKAVDNPQQFSDLVERATYAISRGREFLTVRDYLMAADAEVDWIIDRLLSPTDKVLIWGPPKAYKTWTVLDLVRSLVNCTPFLMRAEWTPSRPHKTLLVEEEGSLPLFARRLKRLDIDPDDDNFMVIHRKGIKFTEPDSISYIISVCREYEVEVIIFDPLQRMIPGVNENDAAETGVVWDEIARIQQACPNLTVIVVHHGNKSEVGGWASSRGSSRHGGEVDLGIQMQKHPIEDNVISIWMDGREAHANLEPDTSFKGKITITDDTFSIDARDVEVTVKKNRKQDQSDVNEHLVFQAIQNGHNTRTKIKLETQLSDPTVVKHLHTLIEQELIEEEVHGGTRPNTYTERQDQDQDQGSE